MLTNQKPIQHEACHELDLRPVDRRAKPGQNFPLFKNLFVLFFSFLVSQGAGASSPCEPFRVHTRAPLLAWPEETAEIPRSSEDQLVAAVDRHQKGFSSVYNQWKRNEGRFLPSGERERWLRCLGYFVRQDSDQDGLANWSAITDDKPARVLYPADEDMDGDGTDNILDPAPLDASVKNLAAAGEIPTHLKMEGNRGFLQKALYEKFGVLAIDHTDKHSVLVLKEFIFLLKNGFKERPAGVKYLYAFSGHDPRWNIAAYHKQAQALSIGGMGAYKNSPTESTPLLTALAHELGHAYLMNFLSPLQLRQLAEEFGDWQSVFDKKPVTSLYDRAFFKPHPRIKKALEKSSGVVSQYSLKNIHEWFADNFAALVLNRLGQGMLLGWNWKERLKRRPSGSREYWADYNNLSPKFLAWFNSRL